ncbi:molybdate ABC transporter substrate-binding protein [Enemella sp. A6]|uniref:molybdate ABC transporter substrate-binding protein n=1 Tax=Enemella sp. A6 TaxID=3440152 RepID=UPI003EB7CB30
MRNRRSLLAAVAALVVLPLAACAGPAEPAEQQGGDDNEVIVFSPGALAGHTKSLAAAYEEAGLGKVTFEAGHTPIQREQLAKGATPDVWIAANPRDMKTAAEENLVDPDGVQPLANTSLVVVVAPGNPGNVSQYTDLARPGVKVLLADESLPIWMATSKTLEKIETSQPGFTDKLMSNTVSRELGVQPIVQKVQLGEADAGIVFRTDIPKDSEATAVDFPDEVNTEQSLMIAPVTAGKNTEAAKQFIEFMTEGAGKERMVEVGYTEPTS